ncbi:autoinducer binding domain-containing protein [Marinobacteraceae bacterium S3BR75-40.1]
MTPWQEDQLNSLLNTTNEHHVLEQLTAMARDLGFEYCAYGLRSPLPITQPKTIMLNNYPDAWRERYADRNYLAIDPTIHHCLFSNRPIVWQESVFAPARELWEEARANGLRYGWAQSSRDAQGMAGMLTLARADDKLTASELFHLEPQLSWLTQVAHTAMSQCLASELVPESTARLSARETEVLRWTALGKTASEVSEILSISERTVNFHINNVLFKLDATNKTAASVKAAMLGLL